MRGSMSTENFTPALELIRDRQDGQATLGRLFVDGRQLCFTLERPWLDNQRGVSCIPEGVYHGAIQPSPHFKRDLPELLDVPGRSQILIHVGNYVTDSQGCILVGLHRDDVNRTLSNSRAAVELVLDALAGCDGFILEVRKEA